MEAIEYHILPAVRQLAARLARTARFTLLLCALTALAEPLLLVSHLLLPGIACGMVSTFLLYVSLSLLVILTAWCHSVLLAGRGLTITRWLVWTGAILSPLAPVCYAYSLCCGRLLLYRQAELPFILVLLLLLTALANLPRMAAAPWHTQLRLVLLPLLLLLVLCTDAPGLILACTALKLLSFLAASTPLRELATAAPRIISLPPTGDTDSQPE